MDQHEALLAGQRMHRPSGTPSPGDDVVIAPDTPHAQASERRREVTLGSQLRDPLTAKAAQQLADLCRADNPLIHDRNLRHMPNRHLPTRHMPSRLGICLVRLRQAGTR